MSNKIESILNLFIEEPDRKFNVREVARIKKINPATSSKYLRKLANDGFLIGKKSRNMILYSANTENRRFIDFKIYYNIKKIRDSKLIESIEKELNYPEAIILFGSYSKGENRNESDIDLFILTEAKKRIDIEKIEGILGTEVQLFMHNRREVENMKKTNKELLNNIINGIRLSGFFEVFR